MHTTRIAGRYELADRIGSGGSGSVWRARDVELDRQVAIKLVPIGGDLTPEEQERARTRVTREARAAAALSHPAVVSVFDVVEADDQLAIVMAYVDAPNLRQLVATHGPLDDDRAAAIGIDVAQALRAAHASGIVHRDVKPSNVLVGAGDRVHLTDFGIATGGEETRLTRTGTVIGSPSYIAPEQARGEDPRPAADVWGLGTTLYFAITGASPFERSSTLASLHATLNDEPAVPDPPSQLWPLIARMLAKDPARRPQLAEVIQGLRDPASVAPPDEPDPSRTATLPLSTGDTGPSRRRRPVLVTAAVLTLLALAVVSLTGGSASDRPDPTTPQPSHTGLTQTEPSESEDPVANQPADTDGSAGTEQSGGAGGGNERDAGPPRDTGPPEDPPGNGKAKGGGK